MARRFYPAVLERDENGVFAVWFPDFPGCVAAAPGQEQAIAKAHEALAAAVTAWAEREGDLPEPTPFESVEVPEEIRSLGLFAIGVTPPNPSERINVYLPKALIEKLDHQAEEFGMSRSSYIGLAVTRMLASQPVIWGGTTAETRPKKRRRA
ncbi:MAG TPA: type II toxin-antitoxin system HicB family antitoxin [Caulobacteraceae bacterium]|nr:type II toxin-antitoxin system HicB family antitoxin [Caulobacteraceae bacterium]